MQRILLITLLGLLCSCGNPQKLWPMKTQKAQSIDPATAESFSYELETKSCSTGEHSFSTFDDACNALKDDGLNNSCAENEREELFINSECSGSFS